MGARLVSLHVCLLAGCLSASEGGGGGDGDDPDAGADPGDCERIAFSEDFEDEDWRVRWPSSGEDAEGMLGAQEGRAVITPTETADQYGWFETGAQFDFADRCVHVDVPVMIVHEVGVDAEAFLVAVLGAHEVMLGQSGGELCCQYSLDNEFVVEQCGATYFPDAHARWRLRFEGGEAICDTAPVEGAWTEYGRFDYDGPLSGAVQLTAGTWDTVTSPGQVEFDNINK